MRYMMDDCGPLLVLTDAAPGGNMENVGYGCEVITLEAEALAIEQENLEPINTESDGAYVIYTSGTTGRPKGVLIEHRQGTTYVTGSMERLGLVRGDVRVQTSSISFDHFVEEVYPLLSSGGTLLLLSREEARDVPGLRKALEDGGVTVLSTTPPVLNELQKYPAPDLTATDHGRRCLEAGTYFEYCG